VSHLSASDSRTTNCTLGCRFSLLGRAVGLLGRSVGPSFQPADRLPQPADWQPKITERPKFNEFDVRRDFEKRIDTICDVTYTGINDPH
ncbi:hypothetical protein KC219_23125, partial [Mycobacterium tuberculosis]|nr:hypothetical protein [Mycobacterium tuberculosis]